MTHRAAAPVLSSTQKVDPRGLAPCLSDNRCPTLLLAYKALCALRSNYISGPLILTQYAHPDQSGALEQSELGEAA